MVERVSGPSWRNEPPTFTLASDHSLSRVPDGVQTCCYDLLFMEESSRADWVEARRPTLRDVAERAKVDPSLVSRVVNRDESLRIPESTRERVMHAVAEIGYRPNAAARGLRLARSNAIGLVVPDLANPIYSVIAQGAQMEASQTGYSILLATYPPLEQVPTSRNSMIGLLAETRVDGILIASGTSNNDLVHQLQDLDRPVVMVNRQLSGVDAAVTVDDEYGAFIATKLLLDRGHTRVGHVMGPTGIDTSERRMAGYRKAMLAQGLVTKSHWITHSHSWGIGDGYEASLQLMKSAPELTAIFVSNVSLAIGLYRAASEQGHVIPDDLSVVALHDYEITDYLLPPLTTVSLPLHELGRTAVQHLISLLKGGEPKRMRIEADPLVMLRGSVGEPSTV